MTEKTISEGQYRYLKGRLNDLESRLERILWKLEGAEKSKKKQYLDFEEAIPPKSVCADVMSMLGVANYSGFLYLLSQYYGIKQMHIYRDPKKVSANAIACYHRDEGNAYSKGPVDASVVLHEFFHHLVTQKVVIVGLNDDEETLANRYAELVEKRAKLA